MRNIILISLCLCSFQIIASDWNLDNQGRVIQGYDPVSYFEQNKAQKGKVRLTWDGGDWYFIDQKNLDLFKNNPAKYVPQFGGYCANGLSDGHKVSGDGNNWRVIDGKLYLFYSQWGRLQWAINVPEQIKLATDNWQRFKSE